MNSLTNLGRSTTKPSQHHCNNFSFTEEDYMNGNNIDIFSEGEQIPPADRNVFTTKPGQHHRNRVSYTEEDFLDKNVIGAYSKGKNIPPEDRKVLITKPGPRHCNKVSFTEEDFIGVFSEEEQIPPADRKVFDHPSEDIHVPSFNNFRSSQDVWTQRPMPVYTQRPMPVYTQSIPTVIDDDDAIRIPSLDENLKWSPQNPIITIPNIGHKNLACALSSGEASIYGAQLSILEELKHMTYRQTMRPSKPVALISEEEINEKDVICERGGKSNRHAGTKRYRGMIEKFKPLYQSMTAKTAKTNLSRKIISQIQKNGGRFLKKDEESQEYFVLSPVETTKKVSQAMREKKTLKWTEDCAVKKSEKKL